MKHFRRGSATYTVKEAVGGHDRADMTTKQLQSLWLWLLHAHIVGSVGITFAVPLTIEQTNKDIPPLVGLTWTVRLALFPPADENKQHEHRQHQS